MHATQEYGRRLASAQLIERAGDEIQEATDLQRTVEEFFRRSEPGPDGMLFLDQRRVSALLQIVQRTADHAVEAIGTLNEAAELLRDDD